MDYTEYNSSQRKGQWLYDELLDLYPNTKEILDNSNIFYDDNNIIELVGTHFNHLMNDKFYKWLYGVDEVKTLNCGKDSPAIFNKPDKN